jgi:hypothetical protein
VARATRRHRAEDGLVVVDPGDREAGADREQSDERRGEARGPRTFGRGFGARSSSTASPPLWASSGPGGRRKTRKRVIRRAYGERGSPAPRATAPAERGERYSARAPSPGHNLVVDLDRDRAREPQVAVVEPRRPARSSRRSGDVVVELTSRRIDRGARLVEREVADERPEAGIAVVAKIAHVGVPSVRRAPEEERAFTHTHVTECVRLVLDFSADFEHRALPGRESATAITRVQVGTEAVHVAAVHARVDGPLGDESDGGELFGRVLDDLNRELVLRAPDDRGGEIDAGIERVARGGHPRDARRAAAELAVEAIVLVVVLGRRDKQVGTTDVSVDNPAGLEGLGRGAASAEDPDLPQGVVLHTIEDRLVRDGADRHRRERSRDGAVLEREDVAIVGQALVSIVLTPARGQGLGRRGRRRRLGGENRWRSLRRTKEPGTVGVETAHRGNPLDREARMGNGRLGARARISGLVRLSVEVRIRRQRRRGAALSVAHLHPFLDRRQRDPLREERTNARLGREVDTIDRSPLARGERMPNGRALVDRIEVGLNARIHSGLLRVRRVGLVGEGDAVRRAGAQSRRGAGREEHHRREWKEDKPCIHGLTG